MTQDIIETFFGRYERFFAQALAGGVDTGELSALYAAEFIAASPLGVMAGKNDDAFRQTLAQGYEQYRQIGTKGMRVRGVTVSPIDTLHCVAHVAWTASYATAADPDVAIDFEVHYLMQILDETPKVFGWIAGDEQALLKARGVM